MSSSSFPLHLATTPVVCATLEQIARELYFGVRLTDERPCVLVIMGATEDGTKN